MIVPPPDQDADLVARCRRGEEAGWSALVSRYQRLVYAIVRRAGLDEHSAADVFQTVFERLLVHVERIEDPRRLKAWIVTTAKREALAQRRRGRRTVSMAGGDGGEEAGPGFEAVDEAPLPEEVLSDLELQDRVRFALDRLDERCRGLLALLFGDADPPLAYEEVAHRTGVAVGSVGPMRARCLDKLRERLG
jgi:RNA polymerase sigma factor (sigma-70 family)